MHQRIALYKSYLLIIIIIIIVVVVAVVAVAVVKDNTQKSRSSFSCV